MGRGSKPGERRGGRKAGTPNKLTADLKGMILTALTKVGGVEYLQDQAIKSPASFLTLVGKVLPMTIAGDSENPLHTSLEVRFVNPSKD